MKPTGKLNINSKKRCRHCKEYKLADSGVKVPIGFFCSMVCVLAHGKKMAPLALEKVRKEKDAKLRLELKTASQWRTEAQSAFNAYIRWRDRDKPCISCDAAGSHEGIGGYWDAGHFRSRGAARHLSFHLWNCHRQCTKCNRFLGGNISAYRLKLIPRISLDKVVLLENNNDIARHDIKYLTRIKKIFTRKLKIKKKLTSGVSK